MAKITLENAPLYQWDADQRVVIPEDYASAKINFYILGDKETIVVAPEDGYATIPNELLERSGTLFAFAYLNNETATMARFEIRPQAKPASYVFVPSEHIEYETAEELIAKMQTIVDAEEEILETITQYKDAAAQSATEAKAYRDETAELVPDYDSEIEALQAEDTAIKSNLNTIQNSDKSAVSGYVWTATASGATWKASSGGGGSVTVDDALSSTSENPVQNKVITNKITDVADSIPTVTNDFTDTYKTEVETMWADWEAMTSALTSLEGVI